MKPLQKHIALPLFTLLIAIIIALTSFKQAPTDSQSAAIIALNAKWAKSLHDKKLLDAMDLYTNDAVFYSPDGSIANGKKEVRELFKKVMGAFDSNISFVSRSLTTSGSMAYNSGDYTETLTNHATHKPMNLKGSYLIVLRLEPDGHWRIAQHMWTSAK